MTSTNKMVKRVSLLKIRLLRMYSYSKQKKNIFCYNRNSHNNSFSLIISSMFYAPKTWNVIIEKYHTANIICCKKKRSIGLNRMWCCTIWSFMVFLLVSCLVGKNIATYMYTDTIMFFSMLTQWKNEWIIYFDTKLMSSM